VAERQMDAAERVLDVLGPANQIEAERTARMLREIAAITQPYEMTPPNEADDDRRVELGKGGEDSGEEAKCPRLKT
jgi:hypothetical protein